MLCLWNWMWVPWSGLHIHLAIWCILCDHKRGFLTQTPYFLQTIEFDEGAGAVLRIQPLRAPRDENIYECVAENSEGEVSVQAKLTIIRGKTAFSVHICTVLYVEKRKTDIIYIIFCLNSFSAFIGNRLSVIKYINIFFVIPRGLNVKQLAVLLLVPYSAAI